MYFGVSLFNFLTYLACTLWSFNVTSYRSLRLFRMYMIGRSHSSAVLWTETCIAIGIYLKLAISCIASWLFTTALPLYSSLRVCDEINCKGHYSNTCQVARTGDRPQEDSIRFIARYDRLDRFVEIWEYRWVRLHGRGLPVQPILKIYSLACVHGRSSFL